MALTIGDWRITSPIAGTPPITQRDTTPKMPLGTIVQARDAGSTGYGVGEFIYIKGVASCAQKSWIGIPPDTFTAVLAVANGAYPLGIAMAALTGSYYGWAQISGKAIANCLTSFTDNGYVFLTATPGSVDDTSVAGDLVVGALGASSAVVGNLHAEFELSRPYSNDRAVNN
jgi:hypothetical protein